MSVPATEMDSDAEARSRRTFRKRRRRAVVAVLLAPVLFIAGWYAVVRLSAGTNAVRLRSDPDIASAPATEAPPTLRIGTWNIAHCRGLSAENWNGESAPIKRERALAIAGIIALHDLDIVVLNEVDFDSSWSGRVNQAEIIARKAGYAYWIELRNVDAAIPFFSIRFGNVVLSRYPIAEARRIDFPWPNRWETMLAGKKMGALVTIDLPGGRKIQVAPIHLDHRWGGHEVRIESIRNILAARDDTLPLILAGDFNTSPPGFPRVWAKRASRTAMSLLLEDGRWQTMPLAKPQAGDFTFRGNDPNKVIDWIVVPGDWPIISREVLPTDLSDHRPVVMEVGW